MVQTLANSTLSSYSANSTSKTIKICLRMVNFVLSYLKGAALDCFKSAILDPIKPLWLWDFNLFIDELGANFRTYDQLANQKPNSKDFTCTKAIRLQSTSSKSGS